MKNARKKIIISTVILIIIAAFTVLAVKNFGNAKTIKANIVNRQSQNEAISPSPEVIQLQKVQESDIVLGNANAPVTVIEYASLSCPHCATFHIDGLAKLKAEYIDNGKVKFVHRDFPLNQPALTAAMLALCAAEDNKVNQVNKYYDLLKALFKTQDSWAFSDDFIVKLKSIAKLDGMSSERFDACIKNTALQEIILKSRLEVSKVLQIQSTPTFIVNGFTINGYSGYDEIKKAIDKKLAEGNNSTAENK
jgi:protein-disulfide isomerase